MTEQKTYTPEDIAKLVLYVRCAARKYKLKQYYLYVLYTCYMQYKGDKKAYISRYVVGWSLMPSSISKVLKDLINYKLIERVSNDTFIFTPLAIEVLNYIDDQLINLESK